MPNLKGYARPVDGPPHTTVHGRLQGLLQMVRYKQLHNLVKTSAAAKSPLKMKVVRHAVTGSFYAYQVQAELEDEQRHKFQYYLTNHNFMTA